MKTAELIEDNLTGYVFAGQGVARLYRLSEPVDLDGDGVLDEFVVIRVFFRREHVSGQVEVFPSDPPGSVRGGSMKARVGSYTLRGNPDDPAYLEGCFAMALGLIGGYVATTSAVDPDPEGG